jgi:dehydrogenase/reductase SDR family member 4
MTPANLFDLTGKVAIVTGSTRGIGLAIAWRLAQAGARVVISSRKSDACERVAAEFRAAGHEVLAQPCNVGRSEELAQLVAATRAAWGRIDILVANAAVNPAYGPTAEVADEMFDKIMSTNLKSTWRLCNLVIPEMALRGDGAIIVLSSIAGLRGNEVIGIYGVSKAAEAALVRNLAVEHGPRNVRVNAIAPGLIKTDFARTLWEDPATIRRLEQRTPLRRLGEPDDIAGVALFLAARAGAYVQGQVIVVDGGTTIADPLG